MIEKKGGRKRETNMDTETVKTEKERRGKNRETKSDM